LTINFGWKISFNVIFTNNKYTGGQLDAFL